MDVEYIFWVWRRLIVVAATLVIIAIGVLLIAYFNHAAARTTITTSKPDSVGYTRSTIQENGKRTIRCVSHKNSDGVTITRCN